MVKEIEEKETPKETYSIAEVTTQTKPMIVNLKENKALSDLEFQLEVLNKLDKIIKAVA